MKAKKYFEACGRRDRSRGNICRMVMSNTKHMYSDLDHLPDWARSAYTFGYVY